LADSLTEVHEETITVIIKTYPERARKHGTIVCVGGINQNGELRRLYPIPHLLWLDRNISPKYGFSKWDIIKTNIVRNPNDPRSESHKVVDWRDIEVVGHIGTKNGGWEQRRRLLAPHISSGMKTLNENKTHWASQGIIKPRKIIDFAETDRVHINDEAAEQVMDIQINPIPKKIGFKFKCGDIDCPTCTGDKDYDNHYTMCSDWEVAQMYRRDGFEKTRQHMMNIAETKDLYLIMGTLAHRWAKFINVGIFYPPKIEMVIQK